MAKRLPTLEQLEKIEKLSKRFSPEQFKKLTKNYENNNKTTRSAASLIKLLEDQLNNPEKRQKKMNLGYISNLEKRLASIDAAVLAKIKKNPSSVREAKIYKKNLRNAIARLTGKSPHAKKIKKIQGKRRDLSDRARFYLSYIHSNKWALKKEEFRKSPYCKNCCFICGSTYSIDIHHDSYESLGNEKMEHLLELCRPHHEALHNRVKSGVYKQIKGSAELMRQEFLRNL